MRCDEQITARPGACCACAYAYDTYRMRLTGATRPRLHFRPHPDGVSVCGRRDVSLVAGPSIGVQYSTYLEATATRRETSAQAFSPAVFIKVRHSQLHPPIRHNLHARSNHLSAHQQTHAVAAIGIIPERLEMRLHHRSDPSSSTRPARARFMNEQDVGIKSPPLPPLGPHPPCRRRRRRRRRRAEAWLGQRAKPALFA
ncbi:hypothetical protein BU26DRAFT_499063 [Trematosphaeria pertusa]|uniref:Uncharacterized protein n=1 Tax=Trematosphaeria pertusa TaxID=390896 RepID=A0A6A6J3B4_9PLEO|nr:uncharacterized protein BU26DRAFT_499063 [Trematosphaeria pertusa]KAF2256390.1 hypothetical protein BU26DRAFT_499063 [Trematosphaeria pertusa]